MEGKGRLRSLWYKNRLRQTSVEIVGNLGRGRQLLHQAQLNDTYYTHFLKNNTIDASNDHWVVPIARVTLYL